MANELTNTSNISIDWAGVFELLGDDLLKVKAVHRLACGATYADVAREFGLDKSSVRLWEEDENFVRAKQLIKDNLVSFVDNRMQLRLAQADVFADWLLSIDPLKMPMSDSMRKELIKEKGLMARMYIGKVLDQKKPAGTVRISQMVLNVSESAAKVLMGRQDVDVIDGIVREVDEVQEEEQDSDDSG
jgi:hypothetical protein